MLFLGRYGRLWVSAYEMGVLGSCESAFGKVWALERVGSIDDFYECFGPGNETRGSWNGLEFWGFEILQSDLGGLFECSLFDLTNFSRKWSHQSLDLYQVILKTLM